MRKGSIFLAMALWVVASPALCEQPPVPISSILSEGLQIASTRREQSSDLRCQSHPPSPASGLRIEQGRVVKAKLLEEIDGFAQEGGVSGGLNGKLYVVTNPGDYDPQAHEAPIAGTLRAAIEEAVRSREPAWIVFDPALPPKTHVTIKRPIHLPDNITIDGGCADVTLEAISHVDFFVIYTQNIVVENLAFRKTDYATAIESPDAESCIRLNGMIDRIAILHNDLSECGDGVIDITTSWQKPVPQQARVTVAFNRIADHDKVMLFGTQTCTHPIDLCDLADFERIRKAEPAFRLTLQGNVFIRTSQRHPKVYGTAFAHVVNNVIAFKTTNRPDGSRSSRYGVVAINGARALVEENVFLPLDGRPGDLAVWSPKTAESLPGATEGFLRAQGNIVLGGALVKPNRPDEVGEPAYLEPLTMLHLDRMKPDQAIACVAARAGRLRADHWDPGLCGPAE